MTTLLKKTQSHITFDAMLRFVACLLFFFTCLMAPALAKYPMDPIGIGGLEFQTLPGITLESENLSISTKKISIDYTFRNTSDHDIDTVITFPLPTISTLDVDYSYASENDPFNFVAFSALENGKTILLKTEVQAFVDDQDITSHLKTYGLLPTVIADFLDKNLKHLSPDARAQLKKEGLIVPDGENNWIAHWLMRVQYDWKQHFPAHQTIHLTAIYHPIFGDLDATVSDLPHCYDKKDEALYKDNLSKRGTGQELSYLLATPQEWKDPIKTFHLTIHTIDPSYIVLSCFPQLHKTATTTYEAALSNFVPTDDLKAYFLSTKSLSGRQGLPELQRFAIAEPNIK